MMKCIFSILIIISILFGITQGKIEEVSNAALGNGKETINLLIILMGSTETTFYTIVVYYGVTKIKKTKQTLIASLSADFTGFVFSSLIVRLILM